jgi:hypothetical protein
LVIAALLLALPAPRIDLAEQLNERADEKVLAAEQNKRNCPYNPSEPRQNPF